MHTCYQMNLYIESYGKGKRSLSYKIQKNYSNRPKSYIIRQGLFSPSEGRGFVLSE